MMLFFMLLPAFIMFAISFLQNKKAKNLLAFSSFLILLPIIKLFFLQKPYSVVSNYLVADKLGVYILLVSSVVGIGVTLALLTLDKHVDISDKEYRRFYRFFATFWIGLIISILSNNIGLYWIGLELSTLSTVYMIKTNHTPFAHKEAWNYMIVGAVAISLILFGIILIYASAKPILGEEAMRFDLLLNRVKEIPSPFLFELGFAISVIGMLKRWVFSL